MSLFDYMGHRHIDLKYKNPEYVNRMEIKFVEKMQTYIHQEKITPSTLYRLKRWLDKDVVNHFILYQNKKMVYDSRLPFRASTAESSLNLPPLPWRTLYPLEIDHAHYDMDINLFLRHREIDGLKRYTILIFFLSFLLQMIYFIQKKVKVILQLEKDLDRIRTGEAHHEITVSGSDEISSLAQNINELRLAFVDRLESHEKKMAAKEEFLTALGHDMRTPLHAILGYVSLCREQQPLGKKEEDYLNRIENHAQVLKEFADSIVEYFHEDTKESMIQSVLEKYDIENLLMEGVFDLESLGFTFQLSFLPDQIFQIRFSLHEFRRLIQNLFANIESHADENTPVNISMSIKKNQLVLSFKNKTAPSRGEGHVGLGLLYCKRILEKYRGQPVIENQPPDFCISIYIPLD